jgi:hypothetical protein
LNITAMRARAHTLLILERVLAAFDMAHGTLLHLLCVVAGIVHVLVAELTLHGSLLAGAMDV